MKAFRAALSGRGVLAALLALILLMQVQTTMACALVDNAGAADCPCPESNPSSTDGCTDMATPTTVGGCCVFDLKVAPKVAVADNPATSAPFFAVDFPKMPPPPSTGVPVPERPPALAAVPARSFASEGTGLYLRTARLRI